MRVDAEPTMSDEEEEEEEEMAEKTSASGGKTSATCGVCELPTPKARVHYGGVSCYSCRAFFRYR
jgi:hypothetical protein